MKRIEETFPSHQNSNTDECVRISSIRTNKIDFGMSKFVSHAPSRSSQLSARVNTDMDAPRINPPVRSPNNISIFAKIKPRQENNSSQMGTSRPRLEQVSYYVRPLGPSNVQQTHRVQTQNYGVCCSEVDDDIQEDEASENQVLKNNLKAKILTQGKANLLNNKMQQFNYEKNRSFAGSSPDVTLLPGQTQEILLLQSFRNPTQIDTNFQGPKSFYTTDLKSPTPKDNSFDEINDMLDFSSEGDQPETMDKTEKIPMKEYLEISQACEHQCEPDELLKSAEDDYPTHRLFSRDNDESDYVEILEHTDTEKSVHVNKVHGMKTGKLLDIENDQLNDKVGFDLLQKAIFEHNIEAVAKIIKKCPGIINVADSLGNTPLILTAKLAYKHTDYYQIMKILITAGANPKAKDTNGWSCLDEVVCQSDVMLLSVLFDQLIALKKVTLMKQQEKLVKLLNLTPDFYLEMKWDFESSLIPFFSKLAPSDTFKIWKFGKYLRMDSTLAGFKKLSVKRRDMSLIFNPDVFMPTNFKAAGALFSINRTKSQYTNTLQDVDIEEKKYMMYDMLKAEPLQGSFEIKNCKFNEYKGMFGGASTHKVNGWETKRFDFRLDMEYAIFKKSKTFFQDNYENYQIKALNAKALPPQEFSQKNAKAILTQIKLRNGLSSNPTSHRGAKPSPRVQSQNQNQVNQLGIEKINLDTFENAHVTERKAEASIWLAKNFPMKFEALSPVIEFLSKGNNLLHKVESLLSRDEVKSLISENAFPVKIQVPVTVSIKANITITKYEVLKNPNVDNLFFIPKNYAYVDRKDAQKTLLRTKKRMILVNALT